MIYVIYERKICEMHNKNDIYESIESAVQPKRTCRTPAAAAARVGIIFECTKTNCVAAALDGVRDRYGAISEQMVT